MGLPGVADTSLKPKRQAKLPLAQQSLHGAPHLPFPTQRLPRPKSSGCSWASITPTHVSAPVPMSPWHTGLAPTPDLWPGCRGGERRSPGFPSFPHHLPEAEEAQWDGELSQGAALISLKLPSQFH